MGSKPIRVGQLIAPFGPGSIYTDRRGTPHVVCGLDFWFKKWDSNRGRMVDCEHRTEFERFEPRLSSLLHVDRFCSPPDFREVRKGAKAAPNAALCVPALRFPCWYRHTRTGQLRRFNLDTARLPKAEGGGRWQPVRFIAVCTTGHLCEFPWKEWAGCTCTRQGNLHLQDRGGSELTSVRVACEDCPEGSPGQTGKTLARTTEKPDVSSGEQSAFQRAGISCPGSRPWLGERASEPNCEQPLIGALINQTNLYFARTISALALPDFRAQPAELVKLRDAIQEDPNLGVAKTLWSMGSRPAAVGVIQPGLAGRGVKAEPGRVEAALESLFAPAAQELPADAAKPSEPEQDLLAFRRAEFNVIRNRVDDPEHVRNLRVIPTTPPAAAAAWFSKVNLVERLRETRAFFGFDRLEENRTPMAGLPDVAMRQLFRNPPVQPQERWLPAIEVFGEGIYLEVDKDRLIRWQAANDGWLRERLDPGFITRLSGVPRTLPPLRPADRSWASRYLLIHTLSHILINQLVFECGYSTASLRERIYVSSDPQAPMAAILIYTAAGDSEGTLGGLVRIGRPELLGPALLRALDRASWCSADPVCSEHLGGQGSKLANLAGCHACVLLPETCCETINQGLDRAMLVGTPDARQHGFMAELLESAHVLE